MGYNVMLTGSDFKVAPDKLEPLLQALKDLNKRDDLKTGGAWGQLPDGTMGQTEKWFAWMPADYDQTVTSAAEVFEELGFTVTTEDDGTLILEEYDSKAGAEDLFLMAAAPFVTAGSYLEWEGEDGERWRQDFDGETMKTRMGTITWIDND